eukprot:COSAG01_NODE_9331_length_2481_cov_7.890848_1_plen_826_part_11
MLKFVARLESWHEERMGMYDNDTAFQEKQHSKCGSRSAYSESVLAVADQKIAGARSKAVAAAAEEEARRVAAAEEEARRVAAAEEEARRVAAEEKEAARVAAEEKEAARVAAAEEEAARVAAEEKEAARVAAEEEEAARLAAEAAEIARLAAEEEAARLAAEEQAARLAAEQEAARLAAEEEAARLAAEQEAARLAAEQVEATRVAAHGADDSSSQLLHTGWLIKHWRGTHSHHQQFFAIHQMSLAYYDKHQVALPAGQEHDSAELIVQGSVPKGTVPWVSVRRIDADADDPTRIKIECSHNGQAGTLVLQALDSTDAFQWMQALDAARTRCLALPVQSRGAASTGDPTTQHEAVGVVMQEQVAKIKSPVAQDDTTAGRACANEDHVSEEDSPGSKEALDILGAKGLAQQQAARASAERRRKKKLLKQQQQQQQQQQGQQQGQAEMVNEGLSQTGSDSEPQLPERVSIHSLRDAVCAGDTRLVDLMLREHEKKLGNLAQPDDQGPTPLHWAASHGQLSIAKLLLQASGGAWAVVTQQKSDGKAPLHLACMHGHSELAAILLELRPPRMKARPLLELRDDSRRTALHWACLAASSQRAATVTVLLTASADANAADGGKARLCPLHMAAMQGDLELTRALLASEPAPDVDIIDAQGRTPLVCATLDGHAEVAALLLGAGGCSTISDNSGSNANEWATLLDHTDITALFEGKTVAEVTKEDSERLITREEEAARLKADETEAAQLAAEKETARLAAEEEAVRLAAEKEAARLAAKEEAARLAAEQEAARLAAETAEVARLAAEEEAARLAEEQEAARLAAEEEVARLAA